MSEGSVYRRKDGRWCAKFKDARGTWRYLYRKTRTEARKALREALKARDDNLVPADKLTLAHALDQWLEGMRDSVGRRTWLNRESLVRMHVKTHTVGSKKLSKLTPEDLQGFLQG
jgi:integrase